MGESSIISTGVIGSGFAGETHMEALRRLGFVNIQAIAESNQQRAQAAACRFQIPKVYGSFHELIQDPSINVIHNCSPNRLHLEVNLSALEAGKHIISEKPLGMNPRETNRLLERSKSPDCNELVTAVNFCYRYYPIVQEMRSMVHRGYLGQIYLVHGSYFQDWLLYDTDYNWRVEPEIGGTSRALGDIGSHWCDLVEYVTGMRIRRVIADVATMVPIRKKPRELVKSFQTVADGYEEVRVTTEDLAGVLLVFDKGARGVMAISQVSAGRKNRLEIEICGSERSVAWNQEEPNILWIGERDQPNRILMKEPNLLSDSARLYAHYPGGHNEGYPDINKNLLSNVYKAISQGGRDAKPSSLGDSDGASIDYPSFADGHRAAVLTDAIIESAREGAWAEVG